MSDAIEAGIFNDLGSGSNVDICVITDGNVEYMRNHKKPNERVAKEQSYAFPTGVTRMYSFSPKWPLAWYLTPLPPLFPPSFSRHQAGY